MKITKNNQKYSLDIVKVVNDNSSLELWNKRGPFPAFITPVS